MLILEGEVLYSTMRCSVFGRTKPPLCKSVGQRMSDDSNGSNSTRSSGIIIHSKSGTCIHSRRSNRGIIGGRIRDSRRNV